MSTREVLRDPVGLGRSESKTTSRRGKPPLFDVVPHDLTRRGKPITDLSADKAYTMLELVEHLRPLTLYHWRKATEWLSEEADREYGWGGWKRRPLELTELLALSRSVRLPRHEQLRRRCALLFAGLRRAIQDAIASPHCAVKGIGPDSNPVEIPRELGPQLKINLEKNTLTTLDGGIVWRGIMVRRIPSAGDVGIPQPPFDGKDWQMRQVRALLLTKFKGKKIERDGKTVLIPIKPRGWSINKINREIVSPAGAGYTCSDDTVSRAFGLKK
jgi:hypothetical protein